MRTVTTVEITRETLTEALERAVESKGYDYIYEPPGAGRCVYTHEGEPSCIFGHALTDLGVEIDPHWNVGGGITIDKVLLDHLGVQDVTLATAAGRCQSWQDDQLTWGKALDIFKEHLEANNGD